MSEPDPIRIPISDPSSEEATHAQLDALRERLEAKLQGAVGGSLGEVELTCEREIEGDGDYEVELKLRRGMRIGADVELDWDAGDDHAELTYHSASTLQMMVLVGLTLGGALAAFVMFVAEIPPAGMIPGRKLGALIAIICGGALGMMIAVPLASALQAGTGPENQQLLDAVGELVRPEAEAFLAEA